MSTNTDPTTPPDRLAADDGVRVGTFSYLPPMTDTAVRAQLERLLAADFDPAIEHTDPDHTGARYWRMWRLPFFGQRSASAVLDEVAACSAANPGHLVRVIGYDRLRQTQATAFVVDEGATRGNGS